MPISKAQQRATAKYVSKSYDRIEAKVPKGQKEAIQAHAEITDGTLNKFMNRAITETMDRDAGGPQDVSRAALEIETVSLPLGVIKTAQEAAKAAGETVPVFIARAVETQAQRDVLASKEEGGERG